MRRRGFVRIAAAVAVIGAAACFSDPTSSLRSGATRLSIAQQTLTLQTGDSSTIQALLYDNQGNQMTLAGATWTSDDATVAAVRVDSTNPPPGATYSRAIIRGVTAQGGVTHVVLAIGGLADTVRVVVFPATFPGNTVISGTAFVDTVLAPPAAPDIFTTGDTLTLSSTASVTFTGSSTVSFGPFPGYIISQSATSIKVMSRQPYDGPATITNLVFAGSTETGPLAIASINTSSIKIQRSRFRGTMTVAGDTITLTPSAGSTFNTSGSKTAVQFNGSPATIFALSAAQIRAIAPILTGANYTGGVTVYNLGVGAITVDSAFSSTNVTMNRASFSGTTTMTADSDTLILTPPSGATFVTSGTKSAVKFGGTAAVVFVLASNQIKALASANYTGGLTVTNITLGIANVDSLKQATAISIKKAVYPGAVSNGAGRLLDTVVVASTAAAKFTASGASASNVTLGGQTTLLISRTTDTMKVISVVGSSGPLTVSNVVVGASTIPSLTTANNVNVSTTTTGEVNEPGNNSEAKPDTVKFAGAADTITVYSSLDCEDNGTACPGNGDYVDYYYLNLLTTNKLKAIINWYGTGSGGTPYGVDHTNPDLDVMICKTTGGTCAYDGSDIDGFSGATNVQPETASTTAALAPQGVFISVWAFSTPSPIAYRLRVLRF